MFLIAFLGVIILHLFLLRDVALAINLQDTLNSTFSLCMPLGGQMQLWWDLNTTHLNYALVGYVADDEYIAFGPALPGAIDRLMGYANAIAGGVNSSSGLAWATDMFMSAYIPCDTTFSPPVGVCPVSSFLSTEQQSTEFNPLIAASRMNGITTLVLSRPLANTSQYTNPINVTSSSFIWAHGPISSGDGPPSYRLAQHGVGPNDYSPLTKLSLASGTIEGSNASFLGACPPLLGLSADGPGSVEAGFLGPVSLAGGGVSVSWRLHDGGVTLMVSARAVGSWVSIAIGEQMTGAHAYVAWSPTTATWRVDGYSMVSLDASGMTRTTPPSGASSVNSTSLASSSSTSTALPPSSDLSTVWESISNVSVTQAPEGLITFSFFRALNGSGGAPTIDPSHLSLIWAIGPSWQDPPVNVNTHLIQSSQATVLNLKSAAAVSQAVPPPSSLLVAHGVAMAVAYAVLMPAAAFAARYLRLGGVVKPPKWFSLHVVVAILSVVTALAGTGLALAFQLQEYGNSLSSIQLFSYPQGCTGTGCNRHSSIGVAAIVLLVAQPINAMIRPRPVPAGDPYRLWSLRRVWEIFHRVSAAAALGTGIAAVFTGIQLSALFRIMNWANLQNGLIVWLSALGAYVVIRELSSFIIFILKKRDSHPTCTLHHDNRQEELSKAEAMTVVPPATSTAALVPKIVCELVLESSSADVSNNGDNTVIPAVVVCSTQLATDSTSPDPHRKATEEGAAHRVAAAKHDMDWDLEGGTEKLGGVERVPPSARVLESNRTRDTTVAGSPAALVKVYLSKEMDEAGLSEQAWAWVGLAVVLLGSVFTCLVAGGVIGNTSYSADIMVTNNNVSAVMTATGSGSIGGRLNPPWIPPMMPPSPPPAPPSHPSAPPLSTAAGAASCSVLSVPALAAMLGNGWCDTGAPFNTAACGYDGGDCCDTSLPIYDCVNPASFFFNQSSARGLVFPAPINPMYTANSVNRATSSSSVAQTYNNYYEFTTAKTVSNLITPTATQLMTVGAQGFPGWSIIIDGLVEQPMNLSLSDLLDMMQMEQRVLRHRCVETWAMVIPWTGFPLRKILSRVNPLPNATYVRFESSALSAAMKNVRNSPNGLYTGVTWPYVEGLSIEEAWNDLAFVSVGQYNSVLLPQSGAPIRLTLPWKYGFKSIKSLVRISFVDYQPDNWWQEISSAEYGFWANVNPAVPHPRWSQASEIFYSTSTSRGKTYSTVIYNGYGSMVSYLYQNATSSREYFY